MNYQTSFEAELLERTRHCEVWGYDFRSKAFGSNIKSNYRAHFFPWGLANVDGYGADAEHKLYTLQTLLELNSTSSSQPINVAETDILFVIEHTHIDVLKIDIEGWEFEVLTQILQPYIASGDPLPFGQLLIEIHAWDKKFEDFLPWWEMLEAAGLRPFMTEVSVAGFRYAVVPLIVPQVNLVYQNYNKGKDTDLAEVRANEKAFFIGRDSDRSCSTHSSTSRATTSSSLTHHRPTPCRYSLQLCGYMCLCFLLSTNGGKSMVYGPVAECCYNAMDLDMVDTLDLTCLVEFAPPTEHLIIVTFQIQRLNRIPCLTA
jgi:hypothetical protein